MKIRFFTDPHIGLQRNSHTTPASRNRLKAKLLHNAQQALGGNQNGSVCLGDLFDVFDVDNKALMDGANIYKHCWFTLFGNHDMSNRTDLVSSITVADALARSELMIRPGPTDGQAAMIPAGLEFWCVDHKFTQELFEQALDDAYARSKPGSVLLLHCNYESPFASSESSLNLSRAKAEQLLSRFSYIFVGHEHMARTDLNGKVLVLGNTHPTGFADISDKYCYDIVVNNQQITSITPIKIWDKQAGYLSIDWTDLSELTGLDSAVEFIDVTGVAPGQHMATIAKSVADIWKLSDTLLMVRNNVYSESTVGEVSPEIVTRCQSIPERVSTELAGKPLGAVWDSYMKRI